MDDLDELLAGLDNTRTSTRAKPPRTSSSVVDYEELNVLMRDLSAPPTASVQVSSPTPSYAAKQKQEPSQSSSFYSSTSNDDLDDLLQSVTKESSPAGNGNYRNTQQQPSYNQQPSRNTQQPVRNTQQPVRQTAPPMDDLDELLRNLGPPSATHAHSPPPAQPSYAPSPQPNHYQQNHNQPAKSALNVQATARAAQPVSAAKPAAAKAPAVRALDGAELDALISNITKNGDLNLGGSPASRGDCAHCRKPILGEVIQALGRTYHPEHFQCGNCQQPLGTNNFYEQDGSANCEKCYQELFCSRCAHCDEPITGRCVTALNRKWHLDHFICTQCLGPFPGGTFFERDGRPYCDGCFHNAFSSRCAGCNQSIRGECINALGSQWHPEHFVCQHCQKSFGGGTFYEYGGKPYCEIHYHQQTGSLCAGCGKAVTGRVINALDKKWHPEHFVCSFCMQPLAGGAFTENGGKAYDKECYGKLFG